MGGYTELLVCIIIVHGICVYIHVPVPIPVLCMAGSISTYSLQFTESGDDIHVYANVNGERIDLLPKGVFA